MHLHSSERAVVFPLVCVLEVEQVVMFASQEDAFIFGQIQLMCKVVV